MTSHGNDKSSLNTTPLNEAESEKFKKQQELMDIILQIQNKIQNPDITYTIQNRGKIPNNINPCKICGKVYQLLSQIYKSFFKVCSKPNHLFCVGEDICRKRFNTSGGSTNDFCTQITISPDEKFDKEKFQEILLQFCKDTEQKLEVPIELKISYQFDRKIKQLCENYINPK